MDPKKIAGNMNERTAKMIAEREDRFDVVLQFVAYTINSIHMGRVNERNRTLVIRFLDSVLPALRPEQQSAIKALYPQIEPPAPRRSGPSLAEVARNARTKAKEAAERPSLVEVARRAKARRAAEAESEASEPVAVGLTAERLEKSRAGRTSAPPKSKRGKGGARESNPTPTSNGSAKTVSLDRLPKNIPGKYYRGRSFTRPGHVGNGHHAIGEQLAGLIESGEFTPEGSVVASVNAAQYHAPGSPAALKIKPENRRVFRDAKEALSEGLKPGPSFRQ